jgi:ankyrin repeat protein
MREQWEEVVAALARGFDINASHSINGFTVLHWLVVVHAGLGLVHKALACGANPNARDFAGCSPVWHAASESTPDVLEALIAAGGDVNQPSVDGRSPAIEVVCSAGDCVTQCLGLLLAQARLDLSATFEGKSCEAWAREQGRQDLADMVVGEVGFCGQRVGARLRLGGATVGAPSRGRC